MNKHRFKCDLCGTVKRAGTTLRFGDAVQADRATDIVSLMEICEACELWARNTMHDRRKAMESMMKVQRKARLAARTFYS